MFYAKISSERKMFWAEISSERKMSLSLGFSECDT